MAPIKFEENIREKLQERELQPGKDAWSKLESRLGTELPEKKGNRRLWFAIAASMAGILLVVSYFFLGLNGEQPAQLVVDQTNTPSVEKVNPKEDTQVNEFLNVETEEIAATEEENTNASEMEDYQEPVNQTLIAVENDKSDKVNENAVLNSEEKIIQKEVAKANEGVAIAQNEIPKTIEKDMVLPKQEDLFVDAKVDEVVASIQNMEKVKNTVTAEEIDDLLIKAQRELATQRILNSSTNKIDATALLRDVETEMERSFRDKVFDALGNGYNKIRTAVAQRNN